MQKKLIQHAQAVISCDAEDRVYTDSDIWIEDGVIIEIGRDLADKHHGEVYEIIDATGKFIYPGLVNTHHHFFQTFVRNLKAIDYPNMTVPNWIDQIYRIFQCIDDEVIYYSSLTAFADLIKHGCTTAFDHQYCYTPGTGMRAIDRQMEAAALMGIRYHAGRGTNTLPREEGSVIPASMRETTEGYLEDAERLILKYHDPSPLSMRQVVLAPCQPMNCYRETFEETVKLARRHNVRMHTHLGEGENAYMMARWGMRTLDWVESIGFFGEDVWYAHCWELNDDEYRRMANAGTGLSHCPAPAVLGGFPIIPIGALKEIGVNVSLGCDGSATNDSSNLLESMRSAYLMQCYFSKARGGAVSAYDMLKVATINGAKTLGRQKLGSLEVGNGADLFFIDAETLELTGTAHDPKNLLARAAVIGPVNLTMINGRVVYRDGKLIGVDESALYHAGESTCDRVLRRRVDVFNA